MASHNGVGGLNNAVKQVESLILSLQDVEIKEIKDDLKAQLNCLYEKLSYLMAQWNGIDKFANADYKINESLWGDEYLLKYCFEDCVTIVESKKKKGVNKLFCMVCKEEFSCDNASLVNHMNSIIHLSKFKTFKTSAIDNLWDESHLLRYAYERFIDCRTDNTLYCKLCGFVIPLSHFALLGHINGVTHYQKFKEIVDFKYAKKSNQLVNNLNSFQDSPIHNIKKSPNKEILPNCSYVSTVNSAVVDEDTQSVHSLISNDSTAKDVSTNTQIKLKDVPVPTGKPENTKGKKPKPISLEVMTTHNNYMGLVLNALQKNCNSINFLCEPCSYFEINSSVEAIDEHSYSSRHGNIVLLKQNLSNVSFNWWYCNTCNANFFCGYDLKLVHERSMIHRQLQSTDVRSVKAGSPKTQSEKDYNTIVFTPTTDGSVRRSASVESVNTKVQLQNIEKFHKALTQHIYTLKNDKVSTVMENNQNICFYCSCCNYHTFSYKQWDLHIESKAHNLKIRNKGGEFVPRSCACLTRLICDEECYEHHLNSYPHKRLCVIIESINKGKSVKEKKKKWKFVAITKSSDSSKEVLKQGNGGPMETQERDVGTPENEKNGLLDQFTDKIQWSAAMNDITDNNGQVESHVDSHGSVTDSPSKNNGDSLADKAAALTGPQRFFLRDLPQGVSNTNIAKAFSDFGNVVSVDLVPPNSAIICIKLNAESRKEYSENGNIMVDIMSQYYQAKLA